MCKICLDPRRVVFLQNVARRPRQILSVVCVDKTCTRDKTCLDLRGAVFLQNTWRVDPGRYCPSHILRQHDGQSLPGSICKTTMDKICLDLRGAVSQITGAQFSNNLRGTLLATCPFGSSVFQMNIACDLSFWELSFRDTACDLSFWKLSFRKT